LNNFFFPKFSHEKKNSFKIFCGTFFRLFPPTKVLVAMNGEKITIEEKFIFVGGAERTTQKLTNYFLTDFSSFKFQFFSKK
jgi:hypothetical protein